jgi:hypothetical protein
MTEISFFAATLLSHFFAGFLGFAAGGFVGYKLVMKKIEKGVGTMFSFDDGGSLIDAIDDEGGFQND